MGGPCEDQATEGGLGKERDWALSQSSAQRTEGSGTLPRGLGDRGAGQALALKPRNVGCPAESPTVAGERVHLRQSQPGPWVSS